jgi:hypothetical protein
MRLKRIGGRRELANKPHHGLGQYGKVRRQGNPGGGQHMPVAVKGSRGLFSRTAGVDQRPAKAPKLNREAGYYHPISTENPRRGYGDDARAVKSAERARHSPLTLGRHSGHPARFDQNARKSAAGNGLGSKLENGGRRGTPDSHLGTAGRGGPGRLGKHDAYKGKATPLSESISHAQFEKLGAG